MADDSKYAGPFAGEQKNEPAQQRPNPYLQSAETPQRSAVVLYPHTEKPSETSIEKSLKTIAWCQMFWVKLFIAAFILQLIIAALAMLGVVSIFSGPTIEQRLERQRQDEIDRTRHNP